MATPITSVDSPNVISTRTTNVYNITGSDVGQADINYLLAARKSFTGSLNLSDNTVGFGYGFLIPPGSGTGSITYNQTSEIDFKFFLNGVQIDDAQVTSFTSNFANTESTASFSLGYSIREYDVVTAVGKFR